jgi:hypothetical protein
LKPLKNRRTENNKMTGERHFAVRVDIMSLAANKDLPGHSLDYHDLKVEAPMLMEPSYSTHDEAAARVLDMMAHGRGEEIEVDLPNGEHYKGPRYFYYTTKG